MHVITYKGEHCEAFASRWDALGFLNFNEYAREDGWAIIEVRAEPIYFRGY